MIDRDRKVLPPVHMRDYGFVMDHGRGAEVWDVGRQPFPRLRRGHRRGIDGPLPPGGRAGDQGRRG
jgi:hypothetical protein